MKFKFSIRREIKVMVVLIGLSILIAFSGRKNDGILCKSIVIELENVHENHFVDEDEIYRVVESGDQKLVGMRLDEIDLREIETRVLADRQIASAEIFTDLKGNLVVHVELRRPIARIVLSDAPDAYIAQDGSIMPVSDKYTSRVLLLSGAWLKEIVKHDRLDETGDGEKIFEMIEFIRANAFWRAQIAQLDFKNNGKIEIFPQVTGQRVEFGAPVDIEEKFQKLMIFYKEILPQMGWTTYERVNLEYEGQIIAE
ncbi:MAG: cell division protein FtsQ [Flammeovirgaceae bacterium]|nr:cell division protein FtsQ [Flammeovirgaceae bacterium]